MYDSFLRKKIIYTYAPNFLSIYCVTQSTDMFRSAAPEKNTTNRYILLSSFHCTVKYATHYQISEDIFPQVFGVNPH